MTGSSLQQSVIIYFHSSLFWALFLVTCRYVSLSIIAFNIFLLWPPRNLFPSTLPSIMSRSMLSCLSMCPIHFCCLFLMVFSKLRVSPAISNTSSFVNLSVHLILNIRLHIHISKASNLRDSSFPSCNVHVSLPYNVTLHTPMFSLVFSSEID